MYSLQSFDASLKIKKRRLSIVIKGMSGHKSTKFYEFTEGMPIGFAYLAGSYIYTIEKENSYVYIHYNFDTWNIECYTKVQYANDTTIDIIVFYV